MAKAKKKPAAKDAKKVTIAKGEKVSKEQATKMRKKAGSSNVGEYKRVKQGDFCGPAGGAAAGSYPVNTKKRCRSALAYAHNAPKPSGIKACVERKCKDVPKKSPKKK